MTLIYSTLLGADGNPLEKSDAAIVPWWSFTKTLIAVCALILARRKRLELDETLPGMRFTLRQLLQHTAGVGNYGEMPEYHAAVAGGQQPWPDEDVFARIPPTRLLFEPGNGWAYSNVGYLIVRRTVERAADAGLQQVLHELLLAPLGLHATRLAQSREDMRETAFPDGHDYDPNWAFHGTVIGPVEEAAQALHRILTGDLLAPDERAALLQRHAIGGPVPGRPWQTTGYGLGLMTGTMRATGSARDIKVAGHSAGGPGSVGAVYHAFHNGRTAAVFAAGTDVTEHEALRRLTEDGSSRA